MPSSSIGRIAEIKSNGDIRLEFSNVSGMEPGTRLRVLGTGDDDVEIKVIRYDEHGLFARQFQPFIANDQLKRATGAGVGAMIGTLLEPGIGGVLGALIGTALTQPRKQYKLTVGMQVAPITSEPLQLEAD